MDDRLADSTRIAQLLASELEGHEGSLSGYAVTDADPDVDPTADGARAYAVAHEAETVAVVFVHPDRAHVEFAVAPDVAADAAAEADLRVRPKAVTPPRTLVFVEDGAQVKRVLPVFAAVAAAHAESD